MKKYGLIGYPLSHSFSKKYFEEKFEREHITGCSYNLFPLERIEEFVSLVAANPNLKGLNVTIPYKETVLPYLDSVSADAKAIGAVNCIKWSNNGLEGWNTDWFGFETSLNSFLTHKPSQAFILGTGGSSKAIEFVLNRLNIPVIKVSRNAGDNCIGYRQIESAIKDSNLFINTTPLGMYPQTKNAPEIPYHLLTTNDFLFDLIYNPAETEFLHRGAAHGAQTKNGLEMLELQAEKSWEIWNS